MAEVTEQDGRTGLSRRQMIKASAIAGAAAWSAPVIIDSLASPAAATSGGLPTTCSYALIVFTYNNAGPYIMKIEQGSASCSFSNTTSNDGTFTGYPCGTSTYSGGAGPPYNQSIFNQDGQIPGYPGPQTCDSLFTISDTTITRKDPAVSIIFAVSHHGPPGGSYQNSKYWPVCPNAGTGATTVTVDCG
jgi:hypothetical protein